MLYARSDCGSQSSELRCSDDGYGGDGEELILTVTDGVPVYIFVDSWVGDEGPYTLTLSQ